MDLLKPGDSKHHLFTYHEIRDRLVKLYGIPKTDAEHIWLQKETRRIWRSMPQFKIDADFHKQIHASEK